MSSLEYIGHFGEASDGTGTLGEDVLKVSVYNKTTQHLWLRRIGARRGISAGASSIDYRYVAYLGTSAHEPDQRLGYVGLKTTTVSMSFAGDGAVVDHALDVVDDGPDKSAQVWSGSYVGLGIEQDTPGTLMFGMKVAANLPASTAEKRIFRKSSVDVPPDPIGSFTTTTEGHMSMWAVCDTNDAPNVPVNRVVDTSVYPGATELTPYFGDNFRDNNGSWGGSNGFFDNGDTITRIHHQLRRVSDNVMFWDDAVDATDEHTQAGNENGGKLYTGTTLVRGTAYEWRVRHRDRFNTWSDWSSWLTYTPPTSGSITINAGHTPNGKQETNTPGPYQFIWNHNGGLSTNAVQLLIWQNGNQIRTSPVITKTVANGATGSITWAESTFAALPWGGSFTYLVAGRATDGQWSNFTQSAGFTTDAAPTVPSSLKPTGGLTLTTFPLLQAKWSDADDTTGTGLTGSFEITRPNLTTVTVTPTFNSSSGYWEFQTTATEITAAGTYSWRARSADGTLYSGGTTVAGSATWSTPSTFIYATAGATLAITAPATDGTILTSTPTVTWTSTGQTKYQVRVHPAGSSQAIYDSTLLTDSVSRSLTIPGGILGQGGRYDFYVSVRDAGDLQTDAAVYNVFLSYIAPADVTGFLAEGVAVYTDPWPTAVRLEWQQSTTGDEFKAYDLYRDGVLIVRIDSKQQVAALDLLPLSGVEHTYTLKVVTLNTNGAELPSLGVTVVATVVLRGTVLVSVANPMTHRAIFDKAEQRTKTPIGIEQVYQTWGAITHPNTAPTTIRGKGFYDTIAETCLVTGDTAATAAQRVAEAETLRRSAETFCRRDETGAKGFFVFPAEDGMSIESLRLGYFTVTVTYREEAFTETLVTESGG